MSCRSKIFTKFVDSNSNITTAFTEHFWVMCIQYIFLKVQV